MSETRVPRFVTYGICLVDTGTGQGAFLISNFNDNSLGIVNVNTFTLYRLKWNVMVLVTKD